MSAGFPSLPKIVLINKKTNKQILLNKVRLESEIIPPWESENNFSGYFKLFNALGAAYSIIKSHSALIYEYTNNDKSKATYLSNGFCGKYRVFKTNRTSRFLDRKQFDLQLLLTKEQKKNDIRSIRFVYIFKTTSSKNYKQRIEIFDSRLITGIEAAPILMDYLSLNNNEIKVFDKTVNWKKASKGLEANKLMYYAKTEDRKKPDAAHVEIFPNNFSGLFRNNRHNLDKYKIGIFLHSIGITDEEYGFELLSTMIHENEHLFNHLRIFYLVSLWKISKRKSFFKWVTNPANNFISLKDILLVLVDSYLKLNLSSNEKKLLLLGLKNKNINITKEEIEIIALPKNDQYFSILHHYAYIEGHKFKLLIANHNIIFFKKKISALSSLFKKPVSKTRAFDSYFSFLDEIDKTYRYTISTKSSKGMKMIFEEYAEEITNVVFSLNEEIKKYYIKLVKFKTSSEFKKVIKLLHNNKNGKELGLDYNIDNRMRKKLIRLYTGRGKFFDMLDAIIP